MLTRFLVSLSVCCALLPANLQSQQRAPAACDQYEAAVRADPKNLEAAASLGRCSFRDYEMIALHGDSSRLAFRSSWTTALRALRHAVKVDPQYAGAYRPLFAILLAETRDGCSAATGQCTHVAPVVRDGDSVITAPRLVVLNRPGIDPYDEVIRETRAGNAGNLREARTRAERWTAVVANDRRPHEYLGRALLALGDPAAAVKELERAAALGTVASRRDLFWDRLEALVKSDRGADARRVLDEAASDPARDTVRLSGRTVAGLNSLLGRYRPPPVDSTQARVSRARMDSIQREHPPARRAAPMFSELLAARDTARARLVLARIDSTLAPRAGAMKRFPRVGPMHLESARYHLALGDTAVAAARLAEIEQAFNDRSFQFSVSLSYDGSHPWLGHAWLLAGELAAAQRRVPDAARMYRRVIGLWGGGDRELEPVVGEARAKLGSLRAR